MWFTFCHHAKWIYFWLVTMVTTWNYCTRNYFMWFACGNHVNQNYLFWDVAKEYALHEYTNLYKCIFSIFVDYLYIVLAWLALIAVCMVYWCLLVFEWFLSYFVWIWKRHTSLFFFMKNVYIYIEKFYEVCSSCQYERSYSMSLSSHIYWFCKST